MVPNLCFIGLCDHSTLRWVWLCLTTPFPVYQFGTEAPNMPKFKGIALVVDDSPTDAVSVAQYLVEWGFNVLTATSFAEGQRMLEGTADLALIVTDLNLDHGQTGLGLIKQSLGMSEQTMTILMSSQLPKTLILEEPYLHRFAKLLKPIDRLALSQALVALSNSLKQANADI